VEVILTTSELHALSVVHGMKSHKKGSQKGTKRTAKRRKKDSDKL